MDNCRHVVRINPARDHSILNPQKWSCKICGTTESVWACLSCAHVACGRYNEEHALQHYRDTKHPLALEVNEKYVYCYECEDYVLNDNAAGDIKLLRSTLKAIATQSFNDIESRGRRFLRSRSFPGLSRRSDIHLQDEDRSYTALWHRRQVILGKAFITWRENVRQIRHPQVDDEPISEPPGASHDTLSISSPSRKKRTIIPGVTGLRNLGNTCYMNAILQVLSHLPEFKDFFLDLHANKPRSTRSISTLTTPVRQSLRLQRQTTVECFQQATTTPHRKMGLNGGGTSGSLNPIHNSPSNSKTKESVSLCNELHVLLRVMWSGKWAIVSPQSMLHAVWNIIPFFKGYSQQDAQEFLCEVLEKVENEIDKQARKSCSNSRYARSPSRNLITTLFQGQLISQVTCKQCKKMSETYEPFQDLSLEFPDRYQLTGALTYSQENCHLTEMLTKFTEIEQLEDDSPIYECSQCNSRRRSVSQKPVIRSHACKRFLIYRLPKVLRLHLKRFRWVGRNHREKINVHVHFEKELDMQPYCSSSVVGPFIYHLSSVVIHHGRGFSSGHYTAYCWNDEADSWIHCNDNRLALCNIKEVTKSQAYILVYTREDIFVKPEQSPATCAENSQIKTESLSDTSDILMGSSSDGSVETPQKTELNSSDNLSPPVRRKSFDNNISKSLQFIDSPQGTLDNSAALNERVGEVSFSSENMECNSNCISHDSPPPTGLITPTGIFEGPVEGPNRSLETVEEETLDINDLEYSDDDSADDVLSEFILDDSERIKLEYLDATMPLKTFGKRFAEAEDSPHTPSKRRRTTTW